MADFEIKLKVDASQAVTATGQVAEGFNQLSSRVKEVAVAQSDVASSVKVVTQKELESAGLINTETNKVITKKEELRKAIHVLSMEYPILGAAVRGVFSSIGAAVGIGIFAFNQARQGIERLNGSLSTAEWESYGSVVKAQRDSLDQAALKAGEFADQMERIRRTTETASAAAERLMDVFKAQMSAEEKVDEARKKFELAQAEGEKDPIRKQQRVLEIEERYAARARERADRTARFELDEQVRKMRNEEVAAEGFKRGAEREEARQKTLRSEATVNQELTVQRSRLAASEAEYNKHLERFNELDAKSRTTRSTPEQHEWTYLKGQLDQEFAIIGQQRGLVGKLEGRAPGEIAAWRASEANLQFQRSAELSAWQRAEGIRSMLPTQVMVAGIGSGARAEAGRIDVGTRLTSAANESGRQAEDLAQKAAQAFEAGHLTTRSLIELMVRFRADQEQLRGQVKNLRN